MPTEDERRFAEFLSEFDPVVAKAANEAVAFLRARLPSADVMIYDNYNFLVAGFSPNERPSDAVFSFAMSKKGVALCFLQGAGLPDPDGLLRGSGSVVRNVRISSVADFNRPQLQSLLNAAMEGARVPFDPARTGRFYVRSVSAKKRPRR